MVITTTKLSLFPQRKRDNEHSQILLQSHVQASAANSLGANVSSARSQPSLGQGTTGARQTWDEERGSSPPELMLYCSTDPSWCHSQNCFQGHIMILRGSGQRSWLVSQLFAHLSTPTRATE